MGDKLNTMKWYNDNILFFPLTEKQTFKQIIDGRHLEYEVGRDRATYWKDLPDGIWQFISLHSHMNEENARYIMEGIVTGDGSIEDASPDDIFICHDDSAPFYNNGLDAYKSLCRSIDINSEHVILKLV